MVGGPTRGEHELMMVSYAQNREDVVLDRAFPRGIPGFYVDIGANDPVEDSVTKHFYDLGWRGVNVEPGSAAFERLSSARDRDVNLNVGVAASEGVLTLHEFVGETSGISTFDAEQAEMHGEAGMESSSREVPVTTLARIFEDHVPTDVTVDFLSIDVERFEHEVIEGGDWTRWRPRVVVVESVRPMTNIPSHDRWEKILLDADYLFAAFDGLNRFYVRQEDASLAAPLAVPANVTDHYTTREVQDLQWGFRAANRQLSASRAANQALREASVSLAAQIGLLRDQYERLERGLTATRAEYEAVHLAVADSQARYDRIVAQVDEAGAQAEAAAAMLAGLGPTGLAVARRASFLAARVPVAAGLLKSVAKVVLRVKRSLA